MKKTPFLLGLALLVVGFLFVVASPAAAQGPGEINLTLEPSDAEIAPGEVQTYNITVEEPDAGIEAYNEIVVDVSDNSVANITGFTETKTAGFAQSQIQNDGKTLLLDRALTDDTFAAASEITIATLDVEGVGSVGQSTSLTFNQSANQRISDTNSDIYTVNAFNDAVISLAEQQDPANFTLSDLQPSTATVTEGELVNISANVTNTGDLSGTQSVTLSVGSYSETTTLSLVAGETDQVTFQNVDTAQLGPGTYSHEIATENDTVSGSLTVQAPANFQLDNLNPANGTAVEGEQIDISATVENAGDVQGTQTVTLSVGSVTQQKQVTVNASDFQLVEFQNVDTGALGPGQYSHEIATANDTISGNLTVQDQAEFQVSNVQLSTGTIEQGQRINVSADVQNVGDVQGTQTVALAIDSVGASDSRTIAAGTTETVSFQNVLVDLGSGDYTPTVSTANDSANGPTLTVLDQATVELRPVEDEVRTFKNATVQVVATGASNGVDTYDLDVALNNTNASLLDYELTAQGSGVTDNSAISADNSSISLDVQGAGQAGSSEVVLANLTLQFDDTGTVQADLPTGVSLNDSTGTSYDTSANGTTVSTFGPPPVIDNPKPPQERLPLDKDGDGLYEDVRGDDNFNILDVQALFNNLEEPPVTENAQYFYFNPRPDPESPNILDVQGLFNILDTGTPS